MYNKTQQKGKVCASQTPGIHKVIIRCCERVYGYCYTKVVIRIPFQTFDRYMYLVTSHEKKALTYIINW